MPADDAAAAPDAWIDFLNADGRPLEAALGRWLERDGPATAVRTLVLTAEGERASALNAGLWTFDPASFLPHGGPGDGDPAEHPVWIAAEAPDAAAGRIVVVDDAAPADWAAYAARMYLFDARDGAARDVARARWRDWSAEGRSLAYWSFDGGDWRLERRG